MKVKTSNIEKAISLALTAHKGQKDKAGAPYILHPLRVMLAMAADLEKQAAVLHDVIEDGRITPENLRSEGFSEEVCSAVVALTKKPGESYNQYLNRLNENPIARKVKMADLNDNMNLNRIKEPTQQDRERIKKYRDAMAFLKEKSRR
jgi:(p)ppGpp synthase/HD superfamily hydrolase